MNYLYFFLIAAVCILLLNFFLNYQEKDYITPIKKDKNQSFSELLHYTSLVGDGILLTTQGTLIAGFFFRGDDIQAFTEVEFSSWINI